MTKLKLPVGAADQRNRGFGNGHSGIDYGWYNANPTNSKKVHAAAAGKVISVYNGGGYNQGWGGRVIIEHEGGALTTYNHFWANGIKVAVGQSVTTSTYIGQMGSAGDSDGEHLHFELYINGRRVDPQPYYSKDLPGSSAAAPAIPGRRTVAGFGSTGRNEPRVAFGNATGNELKAGDYGDFDGYIIGEQPYSDGNKVWFRGMYSGDYFWSGSFTSQSKTGLKKLGTWKAPAVPVPKPVPAVVEGSNSSNPGSAPYVFEKDGDWVTDVIPANRTNWQPQPGRIRSTTVVLHQTGTPGKDTYGTVINTFKAPHSDGDGDRAVSAHFVVGDKNITQTVDVLDRAYGSGVSGNDFIQVEIDASMSVKTRANVVKLLKGLRSLNDGKELTNVLHRTIPGNNTSCGEDVDPHMMQFTIGDVEETNRGAIMAMIAKLIELLAKFLGKA